jgi:hypothetical protein
MADFIIKVADLEQLGACQDGIDSFVHTFGTSAGLTRANIAAAIEQRLPIPWLVTMLCNERGEFSRGDVRVFRDLWNEAEQKEEAEVDTAYRALRAFDETATRGDWYEGDAILAGLAYAKAISAARKRRIEDSYQAALRLVHFWHPSGVSEEEER